MAASVTHKPKSGALLTGTEYEAADAHTLTDVASASHNHDASYEASGAVATHAAAGDPHTGYRLESADHSHATTGLQAGQLAQANTHQSPDTDAAAGSLHHTIGTSATQAAAGNHSHTGNAPDSVDYLVGTASAGLSAEIVVGTSPGGELGGTWASPTVDATHAGGTHLTLGTSPSTQAFGDSAAGGSATDAAKTDHKHAMPTLGFGLTGNSAPAVSLTTASAFTTATTSVSAATYADITGASVSLAAGTWLVVGQCSGSSVNAQAIMHVAITDGANAIVSEVSQGIGASGTANVAQNGNVAVHAIVSPGSTTTYKLRAARGLTTITGTWVAMDGAGTNTTNNLTDNSDKGTGIFAVRIA